MSGPEEENYISHLAVIPQPAVTIYTHVNHIDIFYSSLFKQECFKNELLLKIGILGWFYRHFRGENFRLL